MLTFEVGIVISSENWFPFILQYQNIQKNYILLLSVRKNKIQSTSDGIRYIWASAKSGMIALAFVITQVH